LAVDWAAAKAREAADKVNVVCKRWAEQLQPLLAEAVSAGAACGRMVVGAVQPASREDACAVCAGGGGGGDCGAAWLTDVGLSLQSTVNGVDKCIPIPARL